MSTAFAVKVVSIKNILPHPNADRLELAEIAGWQCVVQKGAYKAGDLAIYIPIDSILPYEVESKLFGPDAKIKLHKSRVKTIKIRGAISQGMLCRREMFGIFEDDGYDCTKELGITKFEPDDTPDHLGGSGNLNKKKFKKNPFFKEYGGLDNFKHYPELFEEGEEVVIMEKIHGTNFRFGWVPAVADTFWKRVKQYFGFLPKWEFVFGSNRVQLHNRPKKSRTGFYQQLGVGNVYEEAVVKYSLKDVTNQSHLMGKIFYGEIYGDSVQKNYNYGCKRGERKLICYDVLNVNTEDGSARFQDHQAAMEDIDSIGIDYVPILYKGPYNKEMAKGLTIGDSVLEPSQKIREGVVIKPINEGNCIIGRKILKLISDEYLLRDNTDYH